MNTQDDFQILRQERTRLVNKIADLQTENNKLRTRLVKFLQLCHAVKIAVEDAAFNQLAPETQSKLKEAEIPIGGWNAALKRIKAFLDD